MMHFVAGSNGKKSHVCECDNHFERDNTTN